MIDTTKFEVDIDDREPPDTLEKVRRFFPKAKTVRLAMGDIVYKNTAIELKTWSDFIKALTDKEDKRYRNQLFNFYINPEIDAYYFIYGEWTEINEYSMIRMTAVLGALASALGRYNVKLCPFPNKDYAIYVACKVIEKAHDRKEIRPETFRIATDDRAINMIMEGAERFKEKAAIGALQMLGNVKKVVNSDIKTLMTIKGIGETTASRFFETINYNFAQKKEFEEDIDIGIELIDEKADKIESEESKPDFIKTLTDLSEHDDSYEDFSDFEKSKKVIYTAIKLYCEKTGKDITLERLIKAIPKLDKLQIITYLNDLMLECKIYQADMGKYNIY